jgi:hypothetical protein
VSASSTSTTKTPNREAVGRALRQEGTLAAWAGPLIAVVVALRYTRGAWGGRLPVGDDVYAHLARAQFGINHLWLHGRLDGYLPTFAGGYQEFLFFGPGYTALIAAIRVLTLGTLSTAGAVKVATIGVYVAFPLGAAFLARSFGLTRRGAGIAAILSLLVNNPFGVGLTAVFGPYLAPQQLGAIFACFCIGGAMRVLHDDRVRWIVVTALAAAGVTVTHIISVFIVLTLLAVTLPVLWLSDRPDTAAARRLAIASAAAAGLSAFWWVPFVIHRALHGPVTTWATPSLASRMEAILSGTYLFRPHVFALVLVGAAFAVARMSRNRRWAAALIFAPVGFIVIARLAFHRYPTNEIAVQLENRGIGLAAVIATFGLAAMLAWLTRRGGILGDAVGLAAAAILVGATSQPWATIAQQTPEPSAGLAGAATFLRSAVPAGGRFAEVRQFPTDVNASNGIQHPDFYLAWASGHPALNEFNVESTDAAASAFLPEHLLGYPPDYDAAELADLGVTDVVSSNSQATAYLLGSSQFEVIWGEDGWSVLSVAGETGHPAPGSQIATAASATARLVDPDPEHLRIQVDASAPTDATVAVEWTPSWHVRINGRRVKTTKGAQGMMAIDLPAGPTIVDVRWATDPWQGVGILVTLLTAIAGAWALADHRHSV